LPIHSNFEFKNAIIATAIDGEGSIMIFKHKHGNKQKTTIDTKITITNTSLKWLKKIKKYIGFGRIHIQSGSKLSKKLTYCLTIEGQKNIKILIKRIMKYLIIKKYQAKLLLDYCIQRNSIKGKRYTKKQLFLPNKITLLNNGGDLNSYT